MDTIKLVMRIKGLNYIVNKGNKTVNAYLDEGDINKTDKCVSMFVTEEPIEDIETFEHKVFENIAINVLNDEFREYVLLRSPNEIEDINGLISTLETSIGYRESKILALANMENIEFDEDIINVYGGTDSFSISTRIEDINNNRVIVG